MENEDPDYIPTPTEKKFCKYCQKWKEQSEFYTRGVRSKYLAAYCKTCHNRPFKDERICCPHCAQTIYFIGVDVNNEIVNRKNPLMKRLQSEVKYNLKHPKQKKRKPTEDPDTPLTNLLEGNDDE